MIFHYANDIFRIGFRHDKSRRWLDHYNHAVSFQRRMERPRAKGGPRHAPAVLWCLTCDVQLSHLSKDQQRRNTHCTIWQQSGVDEAGRPNWVKLEHGSSKLNLKAGDHYDREKGRVVALTAALASVTGSKGVYPDEHSFRAAAWAAFHGRRHAQAKGAQ